VIEGRGFAGLKIIRLHAWLLANIGKSDWHRIMSLTIDKKLWPPASNLAHDCVIGIFQVTVIIVCNKLYLRDRAYTGIHAFWVANCVVR